MYVNLTNEEQIDSMLKYYGYVTNRSNTLDTPYMLFYERRTEDKVDNGVISSQLDVIVSADNLLFMKETENNKKIDEDSNTKRWLQQRNFNSLEPERKDAFDDGPPDIF